MFLPENEGGPFELTPAGPHPAICWRFIDLGTQQSTYMGNPRARHEILLSWEIADPDVKMADGRPFTIGRIYTWSMSEKANLRKDLESWRGAPFTDKDFGNGGFDIRKLVGVPCLLNVVHIEKKTGGMRDQVDGIMRLPKGMTAAGLTNPTVFIALTKDEFNADAFTKLSDNLQNKIKASPEYRALSNPVPDRIPDEIEDTAWEPDSSIPF